MRRASALTLLAVAAALTGCTTGPLVFPVQATRFHYDPVADRGTVTVEPLPGPTTPSLEYKTYAAAVEAELLRVGFTLPPAGQRGQYVATVGFTRAPRALPPRRSPVQIGLGGGTSSGGYRGGGVGVGGGVNFPLGGAGAREGVVTELSVRLRKGPDAIWEGQAQSLTDTTAPNANTGAIAQRLAGALFTGFPGESGRTIEVR